jgi:hypothetical protein
LSFVGGHNQAKYTVWNFLKWLSINDEIVMLYAGGKIVIIKMRWRLPEKSGYRFAYG